MALVTVVRSEDVVGPIIGAMACYVCVSRVLRGVFIVLFDDVAYVFKLSLRGG